ncbi:hypothetical protein [Persicirhabdus sediminis]|uniref:Uncharacterized protein n=1 Tax=Persicirhabdus sediminis TaxID=454144 RepID=A0A8J7MEB0_9BACT|nr:hypothetical protein [Persicirhabdus sediminis]MBK1791807.1 hypothetical protein [Persicirhabdus sediminis]
MSEESPTITQDLHQADIDASFIHNLIDDINKCTELIEVLPKFAAQEYVNDQQNLELHEAAAMLIAGQLRGLQIRYQHEGSQWWDTIMQAPQGAFRITRIQHNF